MLIKRFTPHCMLLAIASANPIPSTDHNQYAADFYNQNYMIHSKGQSPPPSPPKYTSLWKESDNDTPDGHVFGPGAQDYFARMKEQDRLRAEGGKNDDGSPDVKNALIRRSPSSQPSQQQNTHTWRNSNYDNSQEIVFGPGADEYKKRMAEREKLWAEGAKNDNGSPDVSNAYISRAPSSQPSQQQNTHTWRNSNYDNSQEIVFGPGADEYKKRMADQKRYREERARKGKEPMNS